MIIAAERILRDVAPLRMRKRSDVCGFRFPIVGADRDDPDRVRKPRLGMCPTPPVARQVVHGAVVALREPLLESLGILRELGPGDADCGKPVCARDLLDEGPKWPLGRQCAGGCRGCGRGALGSIHGSRQGESRYVTGRAGSWTGCRANRDRPVLAGHNAPILDTGQPLIAPETGFPEPTPPRLARALYSVAQMRALEQRAASEAGLDARTLMERAGARSLAYIRHLWPSVRDLGILAGPGNNGGDGFALACQALDAGYSVRVWTVAPASAEGPASTWAQKLSGRLPLLTFDREGHLPVDEPELWIDALLGIGLNRPPEGPIRSAIERLNEMRAPILSLDIPSGLDGDTGSVPGGGDRAVRASATITFLGRKRGLFTGLAARYVGRRVDAVTLGVPRDLLLGIPPAAELMDEDDLASALPPRDPASHKGSWGHLLLVGGGLGHGGAIRLAAEGALRSGVGLVSIVTRSEHVSALISARPEAMVHGTQTGRIPEALLKRADLAVIGCGLGQDRWARALWEQLLTWPKPLVVDADALNWLARSPVTRDDWLLTPHPGEAARLLGVDVETVEADRFESCARLADRYRATVVLKGSGTLVSGLPMAVCPFGNPGMASGGMGDFLSGVIAGLAAQGIPLDRAGRLGVLVHALAGDDAAGWAPRGLLAGDLASFVRIRVNPDRVSGPR